MNSRSALYAILIGGAVMGLLGNLPVINLLNCLLCIWVWLGGAAAVVFYRRFEKTTVGPTIGRGAGLGALAGVAGTVIGALVYLPTAAISGPIMDSVFKGLNMNVPVTQPGAGGLIGGLLIWFLIDIVLYPGFGALGGLVTTSILNRNKTASPA